jgi:hypothetical protein
MSTRTDANDLRFNFEIWKGPSAECGLDAKAICYVENHNGQCGYAELALDFSFAVDALIKQYRAQAVGNWMAPVAHTSRQLVELRLKALLESIAGQDSSIDVGPLGRHDLDAIWTPCRKWLIDRGYKILDDARLEETERLIAGFHGIDRSGDLFRFGISKRTAFDKRKSYDRVGISLELLERELSALNGFLGHWEGTVFREKLKVEMGWDKDPYFDPDDFPRKS